MDDNKRKAIFVTGGVVLGFFTFVAGIVALGNHSGQIEKNGPVPESKPEIGLTFQKVGDILSSRQVVHVDARGCEYGYITHKVAGSGAGSGFFNFVVCPNGQGLAETVSPGDGVTTTGYRRQTITSALSAQ